MTAQSPDTAPDKAPDATGKAWATSARRAAPSLTVAVIFFLVCLLVQALSGAWNGPFLAYPDEPSHFVGSVMARDYFASGFSSNPYQFARNYYDHYPYFAIGYWPPLFYILTGLWLLLTGVGKFQALLLSAAAATGMSWLLFDLVRTRAGLIPGFCAGLIFLTLKEVQYWTCAVMVDLMVGFFCLASAARLLKYLDQPTPRNALLCGLCCACATLTKYSGGYVCVMPLAACVILRRFSLLRSPGFYLLYLPILLLLTPWVVLTAKLSEVGLPAAQNSSVVSRIGPFLLEPFKLFPPVLTVAVVIGLLGGLLALVMVPRFWSPDLLIFVLLYAGCAGLLVFSPVFSPERRYLMVASASLLALAFAGWTAALERFRRSAGAVFAIVLALAVVPVDLAAHPLSPENLIRLAVKKIVEDPSSEGKRILVAPDVEGAVISEFAAQDRHRPGYTLLRPGKLFADQDWFGGRYHSHFQTSEELAAYIDQNPVDYIVWHAQRHSAQLPHERFLEEMLENHPGSWRKIAAYGTQSSWEVYQRVPPARPIK